MRKSGKAFILILCAALMCSSLFGCDSKTEDLSSKTVTIELEGNPTTGFTWNYEMSAKGIVGEIRNEYVSNAKPGDNIVGMGGKFCFEFEGLSEGEVTLNFSYLRTFEENSTIRTIQYVLSVDENKNVSILKEGEMEIIR